LNGRETGAITQWPSPSSVDGWTPSTTRTRGRSRPVAARSQRSQFDTVIHCPADVPRGTVGKPQARLYRDHVVSRCCGEPSATRARDAPVEAPGPATRGGLPTETSAPWGSTGPTTSAHPAKSWKRPRTGLWAGCSTWNIRRRCVEPGQRWLLGAGERARGGAPGGCRRRRASLSWEAASECSTWNRPQAGKIPPTVAVFHVEHWLAVRKSRSGPYWGLALDPISPGGKDVPDVPQHTRQKCGELGGWEGGISVSRQGEEVWETILHPLRDQKTQGPSGGGSDSFPGIPDQIPSTGPGSPLAGSGSWYGAATPTAPASWPGPRPFDGDVHF
jgi:hypothetical protein